MKKTAEIHFENPSKEFCQKIKSAKQEFYLTTDPEVMSRIFASHLCPEFCDQCEVLSLRFDGQFVLEYKLAQEEFSAGIEIEDLDELSAKCLSSQVTEYRILGDDLVLTSPFVVKGQTWGAVRLSTNLKRIKNKQDYILCMSELIECLYMHLEKQILNSRNK